MTTFLILKKNREVYGRVRLGQAWRGSVGRGIGVVWSGAARTTKGHGEDRTPCPFVVLVPKGRILRHRPMFDEWCVDFQIQIDTDLVGERLVRDILADAGKLVGIGDFRPARKGPYGRFTVTSWEKVK